MKSHEYETKARDWFASILPTVVVLVGLVILLKVSDVLGLLPGPAAGQDPTNTVLAHQARAARSRSPAKVVLLGDSTCMMGVDAPILSACLPGEPAVINLALIIWFDFSSYGEVISGFASVNPGQVEAVVLLVTPRKLALSAGEQEAGSWRQLDEATSRKRSTPATGAIKNWVGVNLLRQNLLSHLLAIPLRGGGEGAAYFGFSSQVDAYMTAHGGSLLELGKFSPARRLKTLKLSLAPELEEQCRAFRARMPAGVKLFVGLTPVPASYRSQADPQQRAAMLSQWASWIKADGVLTNLPPTMPDVFFGGGGHTSPEGQRRLTTLLGRELTILMGDNR